ncbi:MAG: VOC family protein [Deltaproteobacteria bacterium]|nr:VOC family protein [Deltaproteobacteria bacterium]
MELAKNCLDVGLFTNRLDEMKAFYGERLRLPYEELLPLGGGMQQHRYGLLGSVLKVNHSRERLPERGPGAGYRRLTISDPRTPMPLELTDPDGNSIELVPAGQRGIRQIEIHVGVTSEADFAKFYGKALGGERVDEKRYRIGETILSFAHDPAARRADKSASQTAVEVIASMRAVGFRYCTVQVKNCDAEHQRFLSMGVWEGAAPVTLGKVARISFIRDPDGNWIEISQRASLTLTGALAAP